MQSRIYGSNGVAKHALVSWLHRYAGVGARLNRRAVVYDSSRGLFEEKRGAVARRLY